MIFTNRSLKVQQLNSNLRLRKNSVFCWSILLLTSSLISVQTFAETKLFASEIFFDASLGTDLSYVQNANRSTFAEDEIDELQIRSDLTLTGAYYGGIVSQARLNYQIYNDRFTNDSQENQTGANGEASVFIGEATDFYELGLTHSSQRQFVNPEGPDVTSNLADRRIFTALAALKTRSDLANFARAEISTTLVDHDDDFDSSDSSRDSLALSFTRKLNPLTNAGVNVSFFDVDFDTSNLSDYDYQRVSIFLSRNVRQTSYSLDIGQYKTKDFSGNTSNGPYLNASFNSKFSNLEFFSNIERDVTDSSIGDNNSNISDTPDIDGRLNIQDQIEREYLRIGIATEAFCSPCKTSLEWDRESQDYFNLTSENSETESIFFRFQRTISSTLSIDVNLRQLDYSLTDTSITGSFEEQSARISLNFKNANRRLFTSLYTEYLKRETDQESEYESPSIGISLNYVLY